MNFLPESQDFVATPPVGRLIVAGVGGAGGRILNQLPDFGAGVDFVVLDSDIPALAQCEGPRGVGVGTRLTRGLGCGGDAVHAQKLAESESEMLRGLMKAGLVLLVTGAGGGIGAGMTPVVAHWAREAGALVLAVAVEPFDFEGGLRRLNADRCVTALQGVSDSVIRVSNQTIARMLPESAGIQELLATADRYVVQVVEGLLRLLLGPSLVPVGLGDLERWTRGRQAESVAAFASAEGTDRVRKLWNRLEAHPFLQPANHLQESGGVLLHVVGGPDLRRDELEFLQHELERCCPQAQKLLGAGLDATTPGRISALLVTVRDGVGLPSTQAPSAATPKSRTDTSDKSLLFEVPFPAPSPRPVGLDLPAGSRDPGRGARAYAATIRKGQQQQFDFVPAWTGRFDNSEGTLHQGENLDEPTFARRGIKLN